MKKNERKAYDKIYYWKNREIKKDKLNYEKEN